MTRPDREGPYSFRPVTRADLPTLARWLEASHVGAWWDEPGDEGPAGAIIGTVEGVATEPIEGRLRVIVDPRPAKRRHPRLRQGRLPDIRPAQYRVRAAPVMVRDAPQEG